MASQGPYGLVEIDHLEITVIVDNEVDPMSPSPNPEVATALLMRGITLTPLSPDQPRGDAPAELRMDNICCGAHGLSIMLTATRGTEKHTLLFDTGPEDDTFERNATRLRAALGTVERIHLSHWHRDHSGGLLKAVRLINAAKEKGASPVVADLHPDRPEFRGLQAPGMPPISLEADPSFDEIKAAGAVVEKHDEVHSVLGGMFLISGEIPRKTPYEQGLRGAIRFSSETGKWTPDESISDERLVAVNIKGKGLVVFTGCSHAGVVNAAAHARELGSGLPLYAIVGGFHLADAQAEKLQSTLDDLKKLGPKLLMPGHCTGWRFKFKIEQELAGFFVPCFSGTRYTLQSHPHML